MQDLFEKTLERLRTERGRYWGDNSEYGTGKWCGLDEAIDIVTQESIRCINNLEKPTSSDEFCEWKWANSYAFIQCKGDDIYMGLEARRTFEYCPYCGKKIKEID